MPRTVADVSLRFPMHRFELSHFALDDSHCNVDCSFNRSEGIQELSEPLSSEVNQLVIVVFL
jgi:hypothetical protein